MHIKVVGGRADLQTVVVSGAPPESQKLFLLSFTVVKNSKRSVFLGSPGCRISVNLNPFKSLMPQNFLLQKKSFLNPKCV